MRYISLSPAYWWGQPVPKTWAYACKDLGGYIGKHGSKLSMHEWYLAFDPKWCKRSRSSDTQIWIFIELVREASGFWPPAPFQEGWRCPTVLKQENSPAYVPSDSKNPTFTALFWKISLILQEFGFPGFCILVCTTIQWWPVKEVTLLYEKGSLFLPSPQVFWTEHLQMRCSATISVNSVPFSEWSYVGLALTRRISLCFLYVKLFFRATPSFGD